VADPQTDDEIGELAVAFNQMAASVEKAISVRDESELRMRQFLADASHELRTPLTSLSGYVDVLSRRDTVDLSTLQEALHAMRRESSRMTGLLNDLLALARYQATPPVRHRIALDSLLNDALDELDLPGRGAPVSRQFAAELSVQGDGEALKRAVINLAENALKYAPGEQRWSLFREGNSGVFRVEDRGPGISQEDLPHVFDRFYRGEKARDRETGGSGLGLAIVKSIVEAHGGSVDATARAGEGATFTVRLPLAPETTAGSFARTR
jgi:two-component system OmpR family sensor kinase